MLHQPQAHLTISPEMVPSLVTITLLLMWKQTTEGRGDALVINMPINCAHALASTGAQSCKFHCTPARPWYAMKRLDRFPVEKFHRDIRYDTHRRPHYILNKDQLDLQTILFSRAQKKVRKKLYFHCKNNT